MHFNTLIYFQTISITASHVLRSLLNIQFSHSNLKVSAAPVHHKGLLQYPSQLFAD